MNKKEPNDKVFAITIVIVMAITTIILMGLTLLRTAGVIQ